MVVDAYREHIALKQDIPYDLRVALRSHERMPKFFYNIAKEIENLQDHYLKTGKDPVDEKTIKEIIYDVTDMFINGVKAEAEKRQESDAKRLLAEKKAQELKELDATASGTPTGEFEEIFEDGGIIDPNDREVL